MGDIRNMKRVLIVILAMTLAILPAQQVFAHVLGEDESGKRGALLHIMPDDNPTVGQEATIYFDLQGFDDETIQSVSVDVKNGDVLVKTLAATLDGTTASVDYIFDSAGTYELHVTVRTNDDVDSFSFQQIVSGRQASLTAQLASYWWAIALLVVCSIGIGVLIVLFIIKRKDIAKRSVGV